jgi:hypothetical protein
MSSGEVHDAMARKPANLKTNTSAQEINVQTAQGLGEEIMFTLGLERKDKATVWIYADNSGGVYVSRVPREGIRKINFTGRGRQN